MSGIAHVARGVLGVVEAGNDVELLRAPHDVQGQRLAIGEAVQHRCQSVDVGDVGTRSRGDEVALAEPGLFGGLGLDRADEDAVPLGQRPTAWRIRRATWAGAAPMPSSRRRGSRPAVSASTRSRSVDPAGWAIEKPSSSRRVVMPSSRPSASTGPPRAAPCRGGALPPGISRPRGPRKDRPVAETVPTVTRWPSGMLATANTGAPSSMSPSAHSGPVPCRCPRTAPPGRNRRRHPAPGSGASARRRR